MHKNNRTLSKRISNSMNLCILFTILLLSIFLTLAVGNFLKNFSYVLPSVIAKNISNELSSSYFLSHMEIKSITEFNSNVSGFNDWKNKLDNLLNMKTLLDLNTANNSTVTTLTESQEDLFNFGSYNYDYMNISVIINNSVIYDNKPSNVLDNAMPISEGYSDYTNINNRSTEDTPRKSAPSMKESLKLWINDTFAPKVSIPIIDSNNFVVGYVTAKLNVALITNILLLLSITLLIFILISMCLSKFVSKYFSKPIIMPLKRLQEILNNTANGNLEDALNNPIVVKKPLKEIEDLVMSTNRIISKVKNYAKLLESKNSELKLMANDQMNTNEILAKKNNQLQYIMDNIGQGFLTFNNDLLITEEYSLRCKKLFSTDICKKKLSELLYPNDVDSSDFIDSVFLKLFSSVENENNELYIQLLPEEVKIDNRDISLEYKIVNNLLPSNLKSIIVILTDITERKSLQLKMAEEKNTLKMVVKSVVNYNDFIDCIRLYKSFVKHELYEVLNSEASINEKITEIFRWVHNFKGNFSQYDTFNITSKLHRLEDNLEQLKSNENLTLDELRSFFKDLNLLKWLDEDMKILKSFLGNDFFNKKETISINKSTILQLEEKASKTLSYSDYKTILPDIRKLRYKPFKDLFLSYPSYVSKLSGKLNKIVDSLVVECADFSVDLDYYKRFTNSLIHIFRNSLDHGIESLEERVIQGKNESATIKCVINKINDNIIIKISDDGRGISLDAIKNKAIEKGLLDIENSQRITKDDLTALIFKNNFSTKEEVTDISGRGIGLYSVLKELTKINGWVKVSSEINKGTEFIFTIPIQKELDFPIISLDNTIKSLVETGKSFIYDQSSIEFTMPTKIYCSNKIKLNTLSSFIMLKGFLQGIVIISFNTTLSEKLAESFVIDALSEDEKNGYMEDVVGECSNIIIGNSIKTFGEIGDFISVSIPTILCYKGASIKYPHENIMTCELDNGEYSVSFSFIPASDF